MALRASGGRAAVTVKKIDLGTGGRAWVAKSQGLWRWTVPSPKGHPRQPALSTLSGVAHTQPQAVTAGLARLQEVYRIPEAGFYCLPGPVAFPGAAGCGRCDGIKRQAMVRESGDWTQGIGGMIVCVECGNKRCPRAADHRLECTGSNEPNQPGSDYQVQARTCEP